MKNRIFSLYLVCFISGAYSQKNEEVISNQFIETDFKMEIDSSFFNVKKKQFIFNTKDQSVFMSAFITNQKFDIAKKHLYNSEGKVLESKEYIYMNHNVIFLKSEILKNDKKIYNYQYILKLDENKTFFLTGTTIHDGDKFSKAVHYSLVSFINNYKW